MRTLEERFEKKYIPEPNSGCWLWIGATKEEGYGCIQTGKRNQKLLRAHRISWELYNGPIPDGLCVLHKCDTPCCVNPTHLFLGTLKDNTQDMMKKGRKFIGDHRGEKNIRAKLNDLQLEDIRLQLLFGHTQRSIAKKYGVSKSTISDIKTNKTWRHI